MKVKAVAAPEAAYILRRALGGVRAWDDMLCNMRLHRHDYFGLTLHPYCKCHDGKGLRPYYLIEDLKEFIFEALQRNPESRELVDIQKVTIEIDPNDVRHWHHIKLRPAV